MKNTNPMPQNAKCVFKGKIFEVWQWEQKMYDGSVEIFERLKRPNTAQVIPIVGDKIIIQIEQQPHKKQPVLSIPGGRFNDNEKSLQAAKREFLEETGYISRDWMLWKKVNPAFKIEWTVYTYIARNCVFDKSPSLDAGEKIKTQLVSFEEFMKIATENPLFYSPEIVPDLLRLQLNVKRKEEFRKLLFGKK